MLFSERNGYRPAKSLQFESMDNRLRVKLWNLIEEHYFRLEPNEDAVISDTANFKLYKLCRALWDDFFCMTRDTLGIGWHNVRATLFSAYFNNSWYFVYDFIEFIVANYPDQIINMIFIAACNEVLERELSAYRLVGGQIVALTSDQEIQQVEQALNTPLSTVNEHLQRALDLLADRQQPDFRNSIKESISAVESICRTICGKPKMTLGEALKQIEKDGNIELHASLKEAFQKLFGYTSDESGIRHALVGKSSLESEDATFMLVACSAFVNFLLAKSKKAGIDV